MSFNALLFRAVLTVLAIFFGAPLSAQAQAAAAPAAVTGTVTDSIGHPISGATVRIEGGQNASVASGAAGAFAFTALKPGIYTLVVQKASFESATRSDIVLAAGANLTLNVSLNPTSFSQLKEIGRASSLSQARAINTSAAAINSISTSTFLDQGTPQVTQVLNETPGVVTTMEVYGFPNGASQATAQVPQIRGALPYETESLIDGHPVSVGASGYFTPLYISPNLLQGIDIAKGPGATPIDINYAIGGSINYRTLEPTRSAHSTIQFDYDSYGGLSTYGRATGTIGGKLGYAFAAGVDGTPGPLNNYEVAGYAGNLGDGGQPYINGVPICGSVAGSGCLKSRGAGTPGVYKDISFSYPLELCCYGLNTASTIRSELAKVRYAFSEQTSFTVSYLGAQAIQDEYNTYAWNNLFFTPPAGYTGALPAGRTPFASDPWQPYYLQTTQGLVESELRTSIGNASVLVRYYSGANDSNMGAPFGINYTFNANTYGGLPIGPGNSTVVFNGQNENYSVADTGMATITTDHFNGLSGEVDFSSGSNEYSASFDRTTHNSYAGTLYELPGSNTTQIPAGSSQAFSTFLLRTPFAITSQLSPTLGNYFINYTTHYTINGGLSFLDASHDFYGPRLGLAFQPDRNTSLRLAAGSSIAPPYLALVTTAAGPPVGSNNGAALYYTQTINSGNIAPETAFGYDIGIDRRLAPDTTLVADAYLTSLHGQFLNSITQDGTYTPTSGPNAGITAPLYLSQAQNLGSSRYEGVELAIVRTPKVGLGYRVQGDLLRAYTFNLPPGFYTTASGPNTTNLGVYPNVNFPPTGSNYGGIGFGRIPYSSGYAELNYRTGHAYFLAGITYYGPDNSFNEPAFGVVNATARFQLSRRTSLQLSGYNLTGAYDSPFATLKAGIAVPLVNGQVGATTAINVGPASALLSLKQEIGP